MPEHRGKIATPSSAEKTRQTDPQQFPNRLSALALARALS
jgi:hypothetical protein